MPGDSWRTIEHLFEQAIQITARARGQWLDNACDSNPEIRREVASLLESDEASAGGFVNTKVERAIVSFGQNSEQPPAQVGVYRLVREIGRGGMGSVYLAERDDDQYRKKVAVKLVRRGMDTDFILMRFRRERQILASLEHPNIGRMLDGGTTPDGLPYLVMEYVNGNSIIEYCQMRNLSIDQKLHLFLEVCAGVEYAHQNFVVHRDLKPGNILVDETGTPKLLDFGISKLLYNDVADASAPSIDESRIMTPDYASPEQIQGDPTTAASDIYSLGAILYELLTGKRPHRIEGHSPQAVELAICFDEPIPPSSAATDKRTCRRLSGDLDSIVLRAMQKAQRDRYATTAQFADDIRNHLAHRPVLAHPSTTVYRVLKYTRRNRVPVAAAALVVIALTTGVVLSRNSAQTATRHFQSLRKLARVFVFDVHDAVRDLPGSTPARQIIVRTGLEYLDNLSKDSGGDPDLESEVAAAYQKIGEIQHANLGNERAALESFQKTIRLLDSIARKRPSDTRTYRARINVLADIGELYGNSRNPKEALASYREALQVAASIPSEARDEEIQKQRATIYLRRAHLERFMEDISGSLEDATQALQILSNLSAQHPEDQSLQNSLASAYSTVGMAHARLGRLDVALDSYRKAAAPMEIITRAAPTNASFQRELMLIYSHIGDVLGNPQLPSLGNAVGAEEAYRKMVAVAESAWNSDRTDQRAIGDYGLSIMRVAMVTPVTNLPRRIALFRKSLELLHQVAAVNPKNVFNGLNIAYVEMEIGNALQASGDLVGAEQKFREAVATADAVLAVGSNSSSVQTTLLLSSRKLGQVLAYKGEREQALACGQKALSAAGNPPSSASLGLRVALPRAYAAMGGIHAALASSPRMEAKQRLQDTQDAIRWFEKARDVWQPMSAEPGFHIVYRRHMEETLTSLAALRK